MKPGDLLIATSILTGSFKPLTYRNNIIFVPLRNGARLLPEDTLVVIDNMQYDHTRMSSTAMYCLTRYGLLWISWTQLISGTVPYLT